MFDSVFDVNMDGVISPEEYVYGQTWLKDWDAMDTTDAGSILVSAWASIPNQNYTSDVDFINSNGDDEITLAEFMTYENYVYRFD